MSRLPIRNNLVLELHVPSFDLARQFYGQFGFDELTYDETSGGGSDLGYLVLNRKDALGETLLSFYGDKPSVAKHAYFDTYSADTPRGYGVEITIPVEDVDKLWQETKSLLQDNSISQPLATKRWGDRDFRVVDPFGFYIRFTELVDWGQS